VSRWSRKIAFRNTPQICASGGRGSGWSEAASRSASVLAALAERTPIASKRVAPSRIAGLSGATRRMPPSPNQSSPAPESSRTGGNTIGIAPDAKMCWCVRVTGSTTRRLLLQIA